MVRGLHSVFHVVVLHLYSPGGTQQGAPDPIVVGDNQEYEIERIVSQKKKRGRIVFQVRCIGYYAMEDSWLRGKYLANASDLL